MHLWENTQSEAAEPGFTIPSSPGTKPVLLTPGLPLETAETCWPMLARSPGQLHASTDPGSFNLCGSLGRGGFALLVYYG